VAVVWQAIENVRCRGTPDSKLGSLLDAGFRRHDENGWGFGFFNNLPASIMIEHSHAGIQ